jgi:hypothetical protein
MLQPDLHHSKYFKKSTTIAAITTIDLAFSCNQDVQHLMWRKTISEEPQALNW